MKEKLKYSIIIHERYLKQALEELNNENLTQGESLSLNAEIEKLKYTLQTLKNIQIAYNAKYNTSKTNGND